MNKDLALMIAMSSARARVELGNLMPVLKEHGVKSDDPARIALIAAIGEIGSVLDSVFDQYPEIKKGCEARLKKYGRSYY